MGVHMEFQRELYVGTDDYCVNEYYAEAEITMWYGGSIEDWDFIVYSEDGEKSQEITLTHDEICRLYAILDEEEGGKSHEPQRRAGG